MEVVGLASNFEYVNHPFFRVWIRSHQVGNGIQGIDNFKVGCGKSKNLWYILQHHDQASLWHMQALKAPMHQYMGGSMMWVLDMAKVMEIHRFNAKGEYGKSNKVCILIMMNFSTIIDLL
jgi:hypothetical protein